MKSTIALGLVAAVATLTTRAASFTPTTIQAPFIEQFGESWDERWNPSDATKEVPAGATAEEAANMDLYRYRGEWSVEAAEKQALEGKRGLVAKTPAAHHAISVAFPRPVDPKGKDLVVQYELKLQQGLECGGAYIKLLSESKAGGINAHEFDDKTPYTIMFGPDKCGGTNKVHFIFRHRNSKTGEYEEKHLRNPPAVVGDTNTNLYTLVVHPDNTFSIRINDVEATKGSLLEDFTPSVNPPKEIDDPEDKKPADWVDEAQIKDVDAVKPDDWDEDAPRMIIDETVVKPENWYDDEPEYVADPAATQPEDWDEEEDGEWVAPQVPNPKCIEGGCGEWKAPTKPNPAYKGKWTAPMIPNPAYKGPWAPRKIPNPDYYEDLHPANFNRIMGIGIEIWTMQAGIMFDNFYVGHSLEDAQALANESWALKKELEKAAEAEKKEDEETAGDETETDAPSAPTSFDWEALLEQLKVSTVKFIGAVQADPVAAVKDDPTTAAGLLSAVLVLLSPFFLLGGGDGDAKRKTATKSPSKGKKASQSPSKSGESSAEGDDENEGLKPRRRKVTKE